MDQKALAINGGPQAIKGFEGKGRPKIGHEEFLKMFQKVSKVIRLATIAK